ncbi:MAG: hypothetical protein U0074_02830 [Kouleothrix sp.]
MTQPTPYFPTIAGIWVAYPTKKASFEMSETWWEDATKQTAKAHSRSPRSTKPMNPMEFKANENYWGGKPKIAGVRYQYIEAFRGRGPAGAYKNGEVDVMTPMQTTCRQSADAVLGKEFRRAGACTLGWNSTCPPAARC